MWHCVCLKVLKVNYYKIKNKTNKKPYQNNPSKTRLSKERPGHRGNARNGQDSATVRALLAPTLAAPSRNADGETVLAWYTEFGTRPEFPKETQNSAGPQCCKLSGVNPGS